MQLVEYTMLGILFLKHLYSQGCHANTQADTAK